MRVVSLVPSVTETLLAWGVDVVACTRFCEKPQLRHVGGTKDPDIEAIVDRVGMQRAKELWMLSREGVDYIRRAIADTGSYVHGRRSGLWRSYYDNGTEREESSWVDGVQQGLLRQWDTEGHLLREAQMRGILEGAGEAEIGKDAVTHELVDGAVLLIDRLDHKLEMLRDVLQ